jgi:hypothetical protein
MADQKRWFKVWTSLLVDMDHLTPEAIGRWVRLGCRTALVGQRGAVTFDSPGHLAQFLRVPLDDLGPTLLTLPNVIVSTAPVRWPHGYHQRPPECPGGEVLVGGGENPVSDGAHPWWMMAKANGAITVTFRNWHKYQVDSSAARVRRSRAKKRGEYITPISPLLQRNESNPREAQTPAGEMLSVEASEHDRRLESQVAEFEARVEPLIAQGLDREAAGQRVIREMLTAARARFRAGDTAGSVLPFRALPDDEPA